MRRLAPLSAILLAAALLAGCSRQQWIHLLNNSGALIEILHASPIGDRSAKLDTFTLGPFRMPALVVKGGRRELMNFGPENIFEIAFSGCRAWYRTPEGAGDYGSDLILQVEPDGAIYLAPDDQESGPVASAAMAPQPAGFPVLPTQRRCESDATR